MSSYSLLVGCYANVGKYLMSANFFNTYQDKSNFTNDLKKFLSLKGELDALNLVNKSSIDYVFLYVDSRCFNDISNYMINISTPIETYASISDRVNEIVISIKNASNHLFPKEHEVESVDINVDHKLITYHRDEELLVIIDQVKNILVARATGGETDNNEYKKCRNLLIESIEMQHYVPAMLKSCSNLDEFWAYIKTKYSTYKERREHIKQQFIELINYLEKPTINPLQLNAASTLNMLNTESVITEWNKAIHRINNDPKGAITISKTLLENTMKQLLNNLGIEYSDENDDLPQLYNYLSKSLNLSPSQHTEKIFQQILGGCFSIVNGLSALRNKASDAHASGKKHVNPAKRHAEFVANIAGSLAVFLVTTWEFNNQK